MIKFHPTQRYQVENESGKFLMITNEYGLNMFFGLRDEAIERCRRESPCTLHRSHGQWQGRILTVTHHT